MNGRTELNWLAGLAAVFLALYFLPVGSPASTARCSSPSSSRGGTRASTSCSVSCLPSSSPARSRLRQPGLGDEVPRSGAARPLAYGVASISGTCSRSAPARAAALGGIYKRGAGLGPASASSTRTAINALAIILTAASSASSSASPARGAVSFSV